MAPGLHPFTGVLLAIRFVPPGLTKVLDHRFTALGSDTAIGYFFYAFYGTGLRYNLVGFCQVAAAVPRLIPRTVTPGAVLYSPIVLSILVITVSTGLRGTTAITSLMLLASTHILCWGCSGLEHALLPTERRCGGTTREE